MAIDITCLLAAAFFLTGNAISIAYFSKENNRHTNYNQFTSLEPFYIQDNWLWRRNHKNLELAGGFINAFSWVLLSIPMLQVAVILSYGGTRKLSLHAFIGVAMLAGCAMEFLARFMHLGQSNWGIWLSEEYNLDQWVNSQSNDKIGWRALEVSHMMTYGIVMWVDSFEFLCLGIAFILFYSSVNSLPADMPSYFTRPLAGFGLFIGLFSLANFIFGLFRLLDWITFRELTLLISAILKVALIPIFLLVLACQLPRASSEHKETEARSPSFARSRHWSDSNSTPQPAVEMVQQDG